MGEEIPYVNGCINNFCRRDSRRKLEGLTLFSMRNSLRNGKWLSVFCSRDSVRIWECLTFLVEDIPYENEDD